MIVRESGGEYLIARRFFSFPAAILIGGFPHEKDLNMASNPVHTLVFFAASLLLLLLAGPAAANPAFARQYNMSCVACHAAFPRLNNFGEQFMANNIRLPNWREAIGVDTGDDQLMLPKFPPLAVRAQAFVTARQAEAVDATGDTLADPGTDFQAPYLVKLISGSPLSDHISYYFYAILAEKGANGETIVEDAWISHDDVFGSGVGMILGQFAVSDLMFPRETRLTVQDFLAYRMADVTYQRGVIFDTDADPVSLALGAVNGNGINANERVNSGGYQRPDHAFDNDSTKSIFGRVGSEWGPVKFGAFSLVGKQRNDAGTDDVHKRIFGVDISANHGDKLFWFFQYLQNHWYDFLADGEQSEWCAGFIGIDYVYSDRWTFSALMNYAEANDMANTGTVYEGIDTSQFTATASYYFMRNVKGVIELNADFQGIDSNRHDGIGHDTKEGYALLGFDVAF